MLFISSQNPVTSARELYRLLPAIMLSLFSYFTIPLLPQEGGYSFLELGEYSGC